MLRNKFLSQRKVFFSLTVLLSFSLVFLPPSFSQTQNIVDSDTEKNVYLYKGDLVTVKVKSLTKVAVANPAVVDITNASTEELVLVGRQIGETQIFIWDENGKKQLLARVVSTDLNLVGNRMIALVQSAGVQGVTFEKNYDEGKIVVGGHLSKNDKAKLDEVLKPFSDDIINLVIEDGELIQIDVQFSELDTTLTKILGFDWSTGSQLAFTFAETLPTQDGNFTSLFKIGDFSRTSAILSIVNLVISEGKGRILSKPSLVVTNGEQASFLVGGEIPVTSTTSSNGGTTTQQNVSYKSYGVDLTVTPELRDGKIDITVTVTVRTIDDSNAVGENVAFLTRTATTKVRLADAQTIVLAGMINRRQGETVKRVPFLSKAPVVGSFFQSKNMPNQEQELVVSLTPTILKDLPVSSGQKKVNVQASADNTKSDIEKEKTPQGSSQSDKAGVQRVDSIPTENQDKKATGENKALAGKKLEESQAGKSQTKTSAQLKAEKKAAAKKARADARQAKEKLKKEKAQKIKQEKEARKVSRKQSVKVAEKKVVEKKVVEKKTSSKKAVTSRDASVKPQKSAKSPKTVLNENPAQLKKEDSKNLEDPSLNMFLDDPGVADPKNVLTDAEIQAIREKYTAKIKEQMSSTISYPYEAKESRWEGTVVLDITILPDGSVKNAVVNKSSGYAIFDKDALNTAEILSPYDRFAPAKNLRELVVSVPLEYSEKAILGTIPSEEK